jgi:hypothetical protein
MFNVRAISRKKNAGMRKTVRISVNQKYRFSEHEILYYDNSLKVPGDQEGLFKLVVQLRKFFNSVIYNTATGYVLLAYLTNI